MPLEQGHSRETISANIGELIKAGHKPNQAAAIAYKTAGLAKDMSDEDWDELLGGLGKFFAEERAEPHHQVDDVLPEHTREEIGTVGSEHREELPDTDFLEPKEKKYPVKLNGKYDRNLLLAAAREARMHGHEELAKKADAIRAKEFANDRLALDFDSVRRYDDDGRLHVEQANISKACVNPYYGREIPGADALGLDANKIYHLLRDPEELKKAVDKLNGVPLQREHKPTSADDHQTMDTVGAVGTNAVYEHPYLKNALVIWPQESIDGVENNSKRQLSMGYKYRADMSPGTYEGEQYDGVMRDIVPNHVALVENGRAGPDVVVGDSAFGSTTTSQEISMGKHVLTRKAAVAQGAVLAHLKPLLAADASIDLGEAFVGINAKNLKEKRQSILDALKPKIKLKAGTAMDAALKAIGGALDEAEPMEVEEGIDTDPNSGLPMTEMRREGEDDGGMEKVMAYLKEHAPEHHAAVTKMMGGEDEEMKRKEGEDDETFMNRVLKAHDAKRARDAEPEKKVVTPEAMDAAIQAAAKKERDRLTGMHEALVFVEPWVGRMTQAHDSAESVYRAACGMLGMKVDDVKDPAALKHIVSGQPKAADRGRRAAEQVQAADSSEASGKFDEMFPGASRIERAA